MNKIKYIGCFLEQSLVLKYAEQQNTDRLYRVIEHPHVTFAYEPEMIPYELFGLSVTVRVTSYGNDGENEAFGVEFENLPKELLELAMLIEIPHITISISKNSKPVNSKYIKFNPIEPFCIQGVFGGKDHEGFVYTDITT